MSNRKNYFFLNFQGILCSPPGYQEVKDSDFRKRPFILIPDNNVCTHVSEYGSINQDKIKKVKAKDFLNYCQASNITVVPDYGLLERASEPATLKFNVNKLNNCESEFWKRLCHYSNNNKISSRVESIEDLKGVLYPFYAYLLMIKLILLKRGPSRLNARSNFQDLYEFTNKIGIREVLPWQFATAVFGGNNDLKSFISPKKDKFKKGDTFKALWGAAWDLFYLQLIHQHNGLREKGNNYYPQYILVTDDGPCSTIGDFARVTSAFDYGDTIYDVVAMKSDFPHLSDISSFLSEINFDMELDVHQRSVARASMSKSDYQNHIKEIINRAESLIMELKSQIQIREKKGFG